MNIKKFLLIFLAISILAVGTAGVGIGQSPDLKDFKFKNWGKYYSIDSSGKTYFAGYNNKCPFKALSFLDNNYGAEILLNENGVQTISEGDSLPLKEDFKLAIKSINLANKEINLELIRAFRRYSFTRPTFQVVSSNTVKLSGDKPIDKTFYYVYPEKSSNLQYIHADPRELFKPKVVLIAVHFKDAIQEGTGSNSKKKVIVDGIWQISTNQMNICSLLNCEDGKECTEDTCTSGRCNHIPDLNTDINNCGECGKSCPPQPNSINACDNGECSYKCNDGFIDCNNNPSDGCEVNSNTDELNCGKCSNACPTRPNSVTTCDNGECSYKCNDGFIDCNNNPSDGCEVNSDTDELNCGKCSNACPARPNSVTTCDNGECSYKCNDGFIDCNNNPSDGCEVNSDTDELNCGKCSNACPARPNSVTTCDNGECSYKCNDGFIDCNNNPADGCEANTKTDKVNCGACGSSCDDNIPCTEEKCENGVCKSVNNCPDGKSCCYGTCLNQNSDYNCGECNKICPTCSYCDDGVCTPPLTGKTIIVGEDATSIRDAVENKANDCDIIIVPAGTYEERISIDKSLTILGAGEGNTVIDGYYGPGGQSWINSVFLIRDSQNHNVHVTLSGLSIQNGYFGIDNSASLSIYDCNITGNAYCGISNRKAGTSIPKMDLTHCNVTLNGFSPEYSQGGAGIYNEGLLSLIRTNITDNKAENATGIGGGIYNEGGRVILIECNITGNIAKHSGGGIFQGCGNTTIIKTQIAHNQAELGGGIWSYSANTSCVYGVFGDLSLVKDNIGGNISP